MRDELRVFCNTCRQTTRHNIQRIFEQALEDGQVIQWLIVQCAGCDGVSFLEKRFINIEIAQPITSEQIYPTRMLRSIKQFDGIPAKLDRIYKEMIDSFNNGSNILCAGGLRALVEGICAEQNISDGPKRNHETSLYEVNPQNKQIKRGRTLECKIEGLAEKHLLTEPQARALHQHRYLGNSALHELEAPDNERLNIAISIIEHVMDALYNIPAQAGNLNRMRVNNI